MPKDFNFDLSHFKRWGNLTLTTCCHCSYGTSYDSLSLGQSNSGYAVKNSYGNDSGQGKAAGSSNNTGGSK